MAEKKKRGLLSWLGFGDEEQSQTKQTEQQVESTESILIGNLGYVHTTKLAAKKTRHPQAG